MPAANGVGKTVLAADLVVSFLADLPAATVIITAPTNRQVAELLWPHVTERLQKEGLAPQDWIIPMAPKWKGDEGDRLIGFATNTPQRMQGFHAENLLIIIDEASGMPTSLVEALEGIAVAENNYILAIGNPNTASGAFYEMTRRPSWHTESISALDHPNVLKRREVIPGATTWISMVDRIRDWCQIFEQPTAETFSVEISDVELHIGPDPKPQLRHFCPNDPFRVRYLGRFPSAVEYSLIERSKVAIALEATIPGDSPKVAALDVARTGGDRTIYGLRAGERLVKMITIPATDLVEQARKVAQLLREDQPEKIVVDAAGMGYGVVDLLLHLTEVQVVPFIGAEAPVSPTQQKRYTNRRAAAYAYLAEAFENRRIAIPRIDELLQELEAMRYRYTDENKMQMLRKEDIKKSLGRSPDMADCLSLLWESGAYYPTVATVAPAIMRPDQGSW